MKGQAFLQLSCTITIALATAGLAHAKERPHVRLSEVLVEDGNSRNEYVELINLDDEPADIGSWQLRRYTTRQSTNPDSKTFSKDACLPGHGHYLWANSEGKYAELADETTKSFSLAKDNGLALYTSSKDDADLIDSLSWGKGYPFDEDAAHFEDNPEDGEAFVYDLDDKKLKKSTDLSPTKKEGACQKESEPEEEPSQPVEGVFLSEILPHPSKGNEEFIELGNQSGANVPLGGWTLRDSSKTGIYTFPKSSVLAAGSLFALFKSDFRFALNDSRETLTLSDAAGRKIHDAAWSTSKQGVSLNNVNGKFQGGTPTPGKPNQSNNLPRTSEKVPKEGFVGFPISFEAGGKDKETKKLKFTWDFGDGHKSYLEKTSHIYKKKGKYTVTLKTTDAQDDKIETFTVTIKAYKAPDIALVALFPNPKGNDTGQEWIEIKNASGKTIDLKNWVIATGSSKEKLVNHPLRESLKLKKGALLRLTRKHASITLTNSIGIVQLLAPDKKKVDEVRYATPTGKSIPQEALYQRDTSGAWVWKFVSATSIPLNTVKDTIAKGPLTPLTTPWPIFQGLRQEKDTSLAKKQSLGSLALGTRLSLPVDMPYIPIQQYQKSLSSGEALEWPGVRVLNTRINLWLAGLQTL